MSHSMTPARKALASGSCTERMRPSETAVMQAMTILPLVSAASL